MLQNLHVKNLALITETEVEFKEGLNILTGETGAGKSIIIGSVALALGEKVPKELLRDNEETALVELVFSVENPKVLDAIRQLGIETEDETVILSRKITSGRAIARINGETELTSRRARLISSDAFSPVPPSPPVAAPAADMASMIFFAFANLRYCSSSRVSSPTESCASSISFTSYAEAIS